MKRALIVLAVLAVFFTAVSCNSTEAEAEAEPVATPAPTPTPVPATVAVSDAADMVVCDFEDKAITLRVWNGPSSDAPKYEFVADPVKGGAAALKVTNKTVDWAGIALEFKPGDPRADWSKHTWLKFWVYGSGSGREFDVDLEDAGKEQFRSVQKDDTAGWKQVTIDLTKIRKRGDWQDAAAKQNGKFDMPLVSVQFCSVNNINGSLVFDDFVVTNVK